MLRPQFSMRPTRIHCGSRLLLSIVALATCAWLGCAQGEGETCQIDGDCDDGLRCLRGNDDRGMCVDEGATPSTPDAGDAGEVPLEPDDDAGQADSGPIAPVDGGGDAATPAPDAGGDAAVPADAGRDAASDDMDGGN